MARPAESMEEDFLEYGDLYTINNPVYGREVVVSDPELLKAIFTGDPDVFHGGEPNQTLRPLLGDRSVLVLDGPAHHRERKLLMPPFHGDRLGAYADVMREATVRAVDGWPRGELFSLLPSMQSITFDVVMRTVFGARQGPELETLRARLLAVVERAQSPLGMLLLVPALQRDLGPLTSWASFQREMRAADECIYALIGRARAARASTSAGAVPTGEARPDVLSLLLAAVDDAGEGMTDAQLRDELLTLLIAGYETTATALCWAIEEILPRPDVLARILDEVAQPGGASLYLDATIKEVLRLRPLVPLLVRKVTAPIALREYRIPAGTVLVPCVYLAQRHPAYWYAPGEFRPERFLAGKPHPFAWVPFGGGARRCIGMAFALYEMRVVLATLLPRASLRLTDGPAKVTLRSFIFAPSAGTRVVATAPRAGKGRWPAVTSPGRHVPLADLEKKVVGADRLGP
jgi:cytochrome P450